MIEIIREESWDGEQEKRELPKNIKQIGAPDIGERIYIENKVHQYLHPYETLREKTVYVLLGKFENTAERPCTFIEAAICLEEIPFDGETPVWNDDSWAYLYKKLKHSYDDMVIVGWAMDLRGQTPNLTVAAEKLHRTYFGGVHQVLYLIDSLEREDAFYSLKNGCLRRREGYYIYYDNTISEKIPAQNAVSMENAEEEKKQEDVSGENWTREPSYRAYIGRREQKKVPSYSLSVLLFFVILGLGYAAFQNHEKMSAMETALIQMNQVQTAAPEEDKTVQVESVGSSVSPEQTQVLEQSGDTQPENGISENTEADSGQTGNETSENAAPEDVQSENKTSGNETSESAQTQSGQTQETMPARETAGTVENASEPGEYLTQGYYIVQKGDNLAAICRKVYQTTAMMEKICEANGIDNPDAIYEGQYLSLPN